MSFFAGVQFVPLNWTEVRRLIIWSFKAAHSNRCCLFSHASVHEGDRVRFSDEPIRLAPKKLRVSICRAQCLVIRSGNDEGYYITKGSYSVVDVTKWSHDSVHPAIVSGLGRSLYVHDGFQYRLLLWCIQELFRPLGIEYHLPHLSLDYPRS